MTHQTILRIDLPIHAVWDRITDFSSYRHWHPSYITVVEWARGGVLDVLWQSNKLGKSVELQARVTARDAPSRIAWDMGVGPLLRVTETYGLTASDGGTDVTHSMKVHGIIGRVLGPLLARGVRSSLDGHDRALAAYCAKPIPKTSKDRRP